VSRRISLSRHTVATTPVGPQVGSSRSQEKPATAAFPAPLSGRLPHQVLSRPAQRSLTLRPACSRDRLAVLCIEGFGDLVTSIAAPIATGWSDSCRVALTPTVDGHLCTAHSCVAFPSLANMTKRRSHRRKRPAYETDRDTFEL